MHVIIALTGHPLHDVMFMNIIKCSYYLRAALISLSSLKVRLLFEGSYYSGCGFYSNKYSIWCFVHVMYYTYVMSGPSLLIESTDSIILVNLSTNSH